MDRQLQAVDQVLKALADPTRVRIVGLLAGGEICVCHIHDTLKIPQSKASRHLAYLRRAGLVEAEKRGLWVYYRLAPGTDGVVQALLDAAQHCIGHLDVARRDATRLERITGCCVPTPTALTLNCCQTAMAKPAAAS
jgi:ArsR family transcriptional regulator